MPKQPRESRVGMRAFAVAALVLGFLALPGTAHALSCSTGQNKFVERSATAPYSAGSMGTLLTNNTATIDSCGILLGTVHQYFGISGTTLDFAEIGFRILGSDKSHFLIFREYTNYPYTDLQLTADTFTSGGYVSFNVSPTTIGVSPAWKCQYSLGSSQTNWITYGNTDPNASFYTSALPESEVERFGNTDGYVYATGLNFRPSSGGWFAWENLRCSTKYADLIADWDAQKYAADTWYTIHATPPPGDC